MTQKKLEDRQTLTNQDSSVFRPSLDDDLQTGGLDRYSMHDLPHMLSGSKAGIWHRLSVKLSADGPRQNFNSLSLLWHWAQSAVLLGRV